MEKNQKFEKGSAVLLEEEEETTFLKRIEEKEAQEIINTKIDIPKIWERLQLRDRLRQEVVEALARLVIELGDKLSHYDSLLSDDASARLVTLFLRNLVAKERKKFGKKSPNTYFLSGGRHTMGVSAEEVQRFIQKKKEKLGKTLLVTEHIDSGGSVARLVEILERNDVDFDIATVSKGLHIYPRGIVKRLYFGEVSGVGLGFYALRRRMGVEKDFGGAHPVKQVGFDSEAVREGRDDMNMLADELSKLLDK